MQTDPWHFLGLRQLGDYNQEPDLQIGGLYRWVRHPLYTAGLAFIWLAPVMTTSLLALNFSLSIYIYIGSIFEERKLLRLYGQPYVEYQRSVPRLIPRPWRHASRLETQVDGTD
jgi:protein-S-isoprenylcysteine O-methyltransferase Ste14